MYTTHLTLIIPALVSLVATYIAVRFVRSYMMESGITSIDHNKRGNITLPTSGGLAVAFGFVIGILVYVFGSSFNFYFAAAPLNYLFATALSVLLIAFVGFLDDINVKSPGAGLVKSTDMMDRRKGLKQWMKPVLTFLGAVPLIAVNAGVSTIVLPLIGAVNFGLLYPLLILPLAVIFVTNAFNLLGGFDGISAGTAFILSLALFLYSITYGTYVGAVISALLAASVFVFFVTSDRYPATLLTGDSFTYGFGAIFVAAVVIGNMEAFGVIIFIPFIIEFILHLRRKFKVTDLGKLKGDGTFDPPYGKKIYSWTHLFMNLKRCREWEVSLYMWIVEIGFVALAFGLKLAAVL
jgi:UDP-N-acetylglucosamine--dolichyl-phosphate N-acetylglucosaminephosphotransferase